MQHHLEVQQSLAWQINGKRWWIFGSTAWCRVRELNDHLQCKSCWKDLADHITFEWHNGRGLLYRSTYILCQIKNTRIAKYATFLTTGTCFAHLSFWNDPNRAAEQSWRIQELFLLWNCFTQESCGTKMTPYTKKHADYCSTCSVAHVVVQCALHRKYLQEKRVGVERWDKLYKHHLCQTSKWYIRGRSWLIIRKCYNSSLIRMLSHPFAASGVTKIRTYMVDSLFWKS